MTDNQLVDQFQRARKNSDLVVIEGFHAIKHAMRFDADIAGLATDDPDQVASLCSSLAPELTSEFSEAKVVSSETFANLSPRTPRTKVIALAKKPSYSVPEKGRIVLLDNPKDLGNIGTIIRTCAAAEIDAVLITGDVSPWHPTVVLGAAGLNFALPVINIDYNQIPNLPIIAFDERGEDFANFKISNNQILTFGSEREGLSKFIIDKASESYRIPMKNKISSINLASAAAIVVYRN